jgi:hypothetical protein
MSDAGIYARASSWKGVYKDEGVVKHRVVLCSVCDTACWPELG